MGDFSACSVGILYVLSGSPLREQWLHVRSLDFWTHLERVDEILFFSLLEVSITVIIVLAIFLEEDSVLL